MQWASAAKIGVEYNVHGMSASWAQATPLGGVLARRAPSIQAEVEQCREVLVLPLRVVCARSCELEVGILMASSVCLWPRKHRQTLKTGRQDRAAGEWNKPRPGHRPGEAKIGLL